MKVALQIKKSLFATSISSHLRHQTSTWSSKPVLRRITISHERCKITEMLVPFSAIRESNCWILAISQRLPNSREDTRACARNVRREKWKWGGESRNTKGWVASRVLEWQMETTRLRLRHPISLTFPLRCSSFSYTFPTGSFRPTLTTSGAGHTNARIHPVNRSKSGSSVCLLLTFNQQSPNYCSSRIHTSPVTTIFRFVVFSYTAARRFNLVLEGIKRNFCGSITFVNVLFQFNWIKICHWICCYFIRIMNFHEWYLILHSNFYSAGLLNVLNCLIQRNL